MVNQTINSNIIIDDVEHELEEADEHHRRFAQSAIMTLKECGYKFLKSTYFTTLRHKGIYYMDHFFYATPEQKICIIDIVILKTSLKKNEQLITDFELLNRDCQQIRSILQKEYQNCSRIFGNESFGTYDYSFIDFFIYKKIKYIPIYEDSYQVIFSVKPLIVTESGSTEYDLQQDSRVDIINELQLSQYLRSWKKEVIQLGGKVYNKKKFLHHDRIAIFDKITIWSGILWLIFNIFNIFLMWHVWFLSWELSPFVAIFLVVLMCSHSFLRYKAFSNACKKEIISPNWISTCSYLRPFTVRSHQLLVKPLANCKKPDRPQVETRSKLNQIFTVPRPSVTPPAAPLAQVMQVPQVIVDNQMTSRPITTVKVELPQKEPPSPPPQDIPKPPSRGIRRLLARQPKYNVNLEVYKQQLGDYYTKLKMASDFENFKQCALKLITIMLACEWYKHTGTPPMNIRIREMSDMEIDYFTQTENLLRQFLDKFPDVLDVEETYRIATIINIGQLNQKTIEHIEWKIDDWLLNFKLLPEDKMKLLYATHTRRTTSLDKPTYNPRELPSLPPVVKKVEISNDSTMEKLAQNVQEQIAVEGKKATTNAGILSPRPAIPPTRDMGSGSSNIEEGQENVEHIQETKPSSDNLERIKGLLNQNEETISTNFQGDIVKSYFRYKEYIQKKEIERLPLPLCMFTYDSKRHSPEIFQEFIEVSKQNKDIAYYAIFDYNIIEPQTWKDEQIVPLERPAVWIWDQKTGYEKEFDFNSSDLANTLADLREMLKNKGTVAPKSSASVPKTEPHGFERTEEGEKEDLMELENAGQETLEMESDPEIPPNIEQTAQVYESNASQTKEVVRHSYPFNGSDLFKNPVNGTQGIVIDTNNVVMSFLTDLGSVKREYNLIPDYYLLEVLDCMHQHLMDLGFGPISFHTNPNFYCFLLYGAEKDKKIAKYSDKWKYELYRATKEEYDFYQSKLQSSCFQQAYANDDTDNNILSHASSHSYKIISNDKFDNPKYEVFRDIIPKDRFTFKINKSVMTILDSTKKMVGEPFFLIDLPEDVVKKVKSMISASRSNMDRLIELDSNVISNNNKVSKKDSKKQTNLNIQSKKNDQGKVQGKTVNTIKGLKEGILKTLLDQPLSEYELREIVKGKHDYVHLALKELENEKLIIRQGKKWIKNTVQNQKLAISTQDISTNPLGLNLEVVSLSQDTHFDHVRTSVLEIVYGAFHTKKGAMVIFPLCKNCVEKSIYIKEESRIPSEFDLSAHLKFTDCECPLPNTQILRKIARDHLDAALKSDEFDTKEGKYNHCAWRWKLKENRASRNELSWAIVIYMDNKNPLYDKERAIIREFLTSYQFDMGNDLKELLDQGLTQNELDLKFYEKLYIRLEHLTLELSTTIYNKTINP